MTDFHSDPDKTLEVVKAERAWLEAHLRLDISAIECLMGDEYTQVNSEGVLLGKQQVLASLRSGGRNWQEAESDEYEIRIYGDVAVVFGRWLAKGVNTGHAFDYAARYTAVWVHRHSRWQMVSDQSTEIVTSPKS